MKAQEITKGMKFKIYRNATTFSISTVVRTTKCRITFDFTPYACNFYGKVTFQQMLNSKEIEFIN
jgi:hypothetical protein